MIAMEVGQKYNKLNNIALRQFQISQLRELRSCSIACFQTTILSDKLVNFPATKMYILL